MKDKADFTTYELKFNILLTNVNDLSRFKKLIDYGYRSLEGEAKIIKSSVDEVRTIIVK